MEVIIHPPIPVDSEGEETREQLMAEVRAAIERGLPPTSRVERPAQ
jgi:hypothetical protein